ncbi:TonB-dependent receptor [Thalassotalea sp. PS06]|uniref:TonB-dependent receptor n=1 Tax=Thalassotalea sp. PS06 TaxID=2594005 RepID=UPI001164D983|nr:TonB-dependent receptor [Thalassotalea sp. PS06]QDP02153.1 TonB-dependent receptor [Thalassotalea sp. PS06]
MTNRVTGKLKLSVLTTSILAAMYAPNAIAAEEDTQTAEQQEIEKIEVTGFRASARENLNAKRFATNIVDAITAEDIGKFPDKNIGDSLQRLAGVGIERRFGEADGISIRGLAPELSLTFLNGQSISTAQWFEGYRPTRGFRSDMLAAELVAGLEVYKSPQADLPEGSIGGTLNIKTRKPLDLDANTIQGSLEYQYSDNADRWDPAISGLYSWKSDDEKFGFLATVSHQERFTTYDAMENYMATGAASKFEAGGDTSGATHATWGAGHAIFQQERERNAYNITFQYQPTDALGFTFNYLDFSLAANNVNSNYLVVPGRAGVLRNASDVTSYGGGDAALKHDVYLSDIDGSAGNDYWFGPDTFFRNTEPEAKTYDLEIEYSHDLFDLHAQIGHTEAAGDIKVYGYFGKINTALMGQAGLDGSQQLTLDLTDNALGVDFVNFDHTDPGSYPLEIRDRNAHITDSDEEDYYQLDLTFPLEIAFIESIKTGVKYKEHKNDRHLYNFTLDNYDGLSAQYQTLADLGFVNSVCGQFEEAGKANTLDCLPQFSLGGVKSFSLDNQPANTKTDESLNDYYEINEDTLALYVMANFETEIGNSTLSGNFGIRYVDYSLDSIANQYNQTSDTWILGVSTKNDYSETLPSLNVTYEVIPDLLIRGAWAKVMSLPNYQDLKNTFSFNDTTFTGSAGNPFLEPWRATQWEIGAEWYFDEASLLSATYFSKDIEQFLFSSSQMESIPGYDQEFNISRRRNGGDAELSGIELQFQTEFGLGFGMIANYTYTDSEVTNDQGVSGLALPGNSEDMWNVTGYWENDMFSARVMANHRGGFFNGVRIGADSQTEEFTSVDVAFSYDVTENLKLSVQGINLTGELYRTQNSPDSWGGIFQLINDNGTRWFVNASVKF